ncbi:unnamed protein product [Chondrus crispus]|uniref:Single-stranded DNA-binding protein n=1 Tax=Chondrus crispus TaxID=2769 RepID=R7QGJ6_CHOCR|nr:unnamed protein product [Chondrus crispus]CDF37642.1 unnamed protein product [Chondrus crispus]|eukprot:XP_005717513.1 unnamed protein product [Chondrus crispus]
MVRSTQGFVTCSQFPCSSVFGCSQSQFVPSKCGGPATATFRPVRVRRSALRSSENDIKCSASQPAEVQEDDPNEFDPTAELAPDELELCNNFRADLPLLNRIILTGRLGKDPSLRDISADAKVCNFSLAVTTEYDPDEGRDQDRTSWFDVEAWGSTAEYISKFGKKGMRVGVSGSLNVSSWTGKDGETRESPIVTADSFEILQSRSEQMPTMIDGNDRSTENRSNSQYSAGDTGRGATQNLSDLPF